MQRTGTPCKHVVKACDKAEKDLWRLVHPCHLLQNIYELYNFPLKIPSTAEIEAHASLRNSNLKVAPMTKRSKGRPKKKSYSIYTKKTKERRCTVCRKTGHNALYCPKHPKHSQSLSSSVSDSSLFMEVYNDLF